VAAEDLFIDDSREWEAVEAICECFPELDVISPFAFVVEAVDSVDGGAFVVSSEKEEVLWVFDFVSEEEADSFQGLLSSIDVVSKEQVVGLWRKGAVLEESEQIVVLAVNVTTDFQRSLKLEKDWLGQEHFAGF
jgi:hypothetical protein